MNWQEKKRNYVLPEHTSLRLSHNKILLSNDVRTRTRQQILVI